MFTLAVALATRREQVSGRAILGIILALGGVLYLLGAEALSLGTDTLLGDALIVANSLCYGAYLVLVGPLVRRHGSLTTVVWLFFFGTLWVAPYGAVDLAESAGRLTTETWLLVGYVVLAATVFAYLVNAWALRHAPPSIVAIYIYLQPVATTGLAMLFLDEVLAPRVFVAALLVFAGIYLVSRVRSVPPIDR